MELNIIWSYFANEKIADIFQYYEIEAGRNIAKKIISNLIEATHSLANNPYLGQIEELLIERKENYRYLLHKNHKIIYSVDIENGFIKIVDVFDSRQNPVKMKRNK